MLKENKLFIDRDCPMCSIYGKGFTQMGLIDGQTLCHYQDMDSRYAQQIDVERAKDEIALYDIQQEEAVYGINALVKIISHNQKCLQSLLQLPLIHALLLRLYRFISYNRKVIYPSEPSTTGRDCTPTLNTKYRWAYLIFAALFTGIILNQFAYYVNTGFGLEHNWTREYFICFGQIAWQWVAIYFVDKKRRLEYLGNMSTVSIIGGILLLPLLALNSFIPLSPWILLTGFGLVVGVMFLEHIRRCKLLDIPLTMTASWVGYRTVVLIIVAVLQWGI